MALRSEKWGLACRYLKTYPRRLQMIPKGYDCFELTSEKYAFIVLVTVDFLLNLHRSPFELDFK
jgi:hypothetical protein